MSNCDYTLPPLTDIPCGDGLAQFALKIKTQSYDGLKILLREYEEDEMYEYCAVIQREIDIRVELAAKGWTQCLTATK